MKSLMTVNTISETEAIGFIQTVLSDPTFCHELYTPKMLRALAQKNLEIKNILDMEPNEHWNAHKLDNYGVGPFANDILKIPMYHAVLGSKIIMKTKNKNLQL